MKKIAGVLIISLLSACASQTTQPTDVEDRSMGADSSGYGADGSALGSGGSGFHPLNDPSSILSQRSVFYDYDSYTVKNEYRPLVIAHAQYLRDNPNAQVILQGNTDDRGSREYNLALGQRRADGVKNIMTLSGARASQIESVSLGEEKPRAYGSGEAAWSENRRTDILYRGE
ncbi:peptidoglycan-associated lipoprotein Pal [Nitrosomonas sp.]|uniref:peptidoglycan-associated lipoprotein Pal n=1 Tax=Nitrosomonas sp. TaxID=42353 RepID=UPI001D7A2A7F|nr:peptidoglycan-associated lipoprotein Pal [Nitrosomonas sp.]MCB1948508.1 peptidoglycan-associated lipoprotein Pal [Nitrosomonas sp.]MCP5243806.1 peptidoglycan-associated lipoprotein Pal [Burkholderiales bacterium]MCP5292753.1 peptidoglycan-associated lipoprotein Pal [Burkholderiales bacterium]MDR4515406.1 peptidoglycan-associated lipoprotein Pal [Nitrosomonas sp.]